jgi:hypothetical protein
MRTIRNVRLLVPVLLAVIGIWSLARFTDAQEHPAGLKQALLKDLMAGGAHKLKDADTVLRGLEKVVSTSDGRPSLFTLYIDKKEAKVLAELPKTDYQGVTTRISFDEKGDIKDGAISLYVAKGGKWEALDTIGGAPASAPEPAAAPAPAAGMGGMAAPAAPAVPVTPAKLAAPAAAPAAATPAAPAAAAKPVEKK